MPIGRLVLKGRSAELECVTFADALPADAAKSYRKAYSLLDADPAASAALLAELCGAPPITACYIFTGGGWNAERPEAESCWRRNDREQNRRIRHRRDGRGARVGGRRCSRNRRARKQRRGILGRADLAADTSIKLVSGETIVLVTEDARLLR